MDERSPYSGREVVGELGEVDLYSSDDEKVGRILEVNPQFIVVERGGGFLSSPEPFFIPRDQIGSEDGDRWYLTVAKDQIDTIGGTSARPTTPVSTAPRQKGHRPATSSSWTRIRSELRAIAGWTATRRPSRSMRRSSRRRRPRVRPARYP